MKVFEFSRQTNFTLKEVKPKCTAPSKCGQPEKCEHKQQTVFCPYRAVTV